MAAAPQIGGFRLSPQQRRLWLLHGPAGGASRVQCAALLHGEVDPGLLQAAIGLAVGRNEILRTAFHCLPGMTVPLQSIEEAIVPVLERRRLEASPGNAEAALNALLEEQVRQPFDLERAPLLRCTLAEIGTERWLAIALPALCTDRAGLINLLREIAACYDARAQGGRPDGEAMQYADLSEWQNELLESAETEGERAVWQRRAAGGTAAVQLPCERRAGAGELEHRAVPVAIGEPLAATLDALALRHEVPAAALLLTAWRLLLSRLTGRYDLTVGVVFDGRSYDGLDTALGPFARTLPIAPPAAADWKLDRLVRQAARALEEAHGAQEYFNWEVLPALPGGAPAVPFAFELHAPQPRIELGGGPLLVRVLRGHGEPSTVQLACSWGAGEHRAELLFDAARIPAVEACRLAGQVARVLSVFGAGLDRTAAEIDILDAAERHALLVELNDTGRTRPQGASVHQLFETQAARHGERPALICEDRELSYAEVNAQANRLAHRLRQLGVGPDALVAICLPRSAESIVAMLAAWKAGGAYLPLDPALPAQRLALMLEDAGARVLICERRFLDVFPREPEAAVCLDDPGERAALDGMSDADPGIEVPSEGLAYVLFTSGSTGRPKGVAVGRGQLANYVLGVAERIAFPKAGSFATVSTFAADLGNTMIFPALTSGGCLHVIALERASDPPALAEYARRHPLGALKIVPSHLEALLGASPCRELLPTDRLVLGGEASRWDLVERVRAMRPDCVVFNHYGPTETTVGVLVHRIESRHPHAGTVPLGKPLPGSTVFLLDRELQPVPVWVPGEIYVGGAGLARGYLGRPDLTAERFVPSSFGAPGERLYRTGDRARLLPDGVLEFLGRVDGQVKIRGFRIELGEIEACLLRQPGVREAVVIAREEEGGSRLVAYVVVDRERPPATGELRGSLAESLPEFMVPAAIVPLKTLPLTPNGKLDRAALPAPEAVRPELSAAYVPPRNEIERTVAAIWQEVLRLPRVGIHDNFFDLGGHSLLLVQVGGRLREAFGRDIPMIEMFKRPTVSSLVLLLSDEVTAGDRGRESQERGESRKQKLGRQRELRQRRRATER